MPVECSRLLEFIHLHNLRAYVKYINCKIAFSIQAYHDVNLVVKYNLSSENIRSLNIHKITIVKI